MREAVAVTALEGGRLVAAAPILDRDGLPSGSAIVSMPTAQLQAALAAFAADALVVTLVVLALGFLLASLVARHIGTPIATIARAAGDVEARRSGPSRSSAWRRAPTNSAIWRASSSVWPCR